VRPRPSPPPRSLERSDPFPFLPPADAYALATPPTQWIEAYTRYNKEWITVDPSRKRIRCQKIMEPQRGESKNGGEGNVLAYVVAYEEGAPYSLLPSPSAVLAEREPLLTLVPEQMGLCTTSRRATLAPSPTRRSSSGCRRRLSSARTTTGATGSLASCSPGGGSSS